MTPNTTMDHTAMTDTRPAPAVDPDAYSIIDGLVQCANIGHFDGKLIRAAQDWLGQADARMAVRKPAAIVPLVEKAEALELVLPLSAEYAHAPQVTEFRKALAAYRAEVRRGA